MVKDKRRYVLITGASSGIGLALAMKFAKEGYGIIMVASDKMKLNRAEKKIHRENPKCKTCIICRDLSEKQAVQKVHAEVKKMGIEVDILVNNAGFGLVGEAADLDKAKSEKMLDVNIKALMQFNEFYLAEWKRRREGKILNVASTGAFQPGPYNAAYFASKAFVGSYSRAIRYEAAPYNIQVCTLYPGTTRTEFFKKEGVKTPIWAMSAKKVAETAYNGMEKNKEMIIPGMINKMLYIIPVKLKLIGIAMLKKRKEA